LQTKIIDELSLVEQCNRVKSSIMASFTCAYSDQDLWGILKKADMSSFADLRKTVQAERFCTSHGVERVQGLSKQLALLLRG